MLMQGHQFRVHYDKLAISTGSQGSTFGIPGVNEHAFFLREVSPMWHSRMCPGRRCLHGCGGCSRSWANVCVAP